MVEIRLSLLDLTRFKLCTFGCKEVTFSGMLLRISPATSKNAEMHLTVVNLSLRKKCPIIRTMIGPPFIIAFVAPRLDDFSAKKESQ